MHKCHLHLPSLRDVALAVALLLLLLLSACAAPLWSFDTLASPLPLVPLKPHLLACCPNAPAATQTPAGMPVGDRLRVFTDYASSFDTRLRNPRWVLEHIDADKVASREGSRKGSGFVEDKGGWVGSWLG